MVFRFLSTRNLHRTGIVGHPSAARQRLSVFCRIPETTIADLELRHHFPYHAPEWFHGRDMAPYRPHLSPRFCLECLRQQMRDEQVLHVQANWAVPVLTHCQTHLLRLQNYCKSCCSTKPVEWLATARLRKILCKRCCEALLSDPDVELREKRLIAVVSLQAVILRAARGVNPDTFWFGRISAQSFMQVIRDLIALLTIGNTEKARCLQSDLQEMHSSVT